MIFDSSLVDACIEGNISDSGARMFADIVNDGTQVFVVYRTLRSCQGPAVRFDGH